MPPDARNPAVVAAGSRECSLLGGLNTQDTKPNTSKKQAPRSRFYRQYSIMRRLRDHGLNADGISLSAGPPPDNIKTQVMGQNFVVEAPDDLAWLQGRDVLIVKADPGEALIAMPLRLAAEIWVAAEAAEEARCSLANTAALERCNAGAPVAEPWRHRGRKAVRR